jgi:hypothetical protein
VHGEAIVQRMKRTLILAAAITSMLGWSAQFAGAGSAPSTLIAAVGLHDAYTITLKSPDGRLVKRIPAGTYTIVVHDHSRIHNFALGSQTANKRLFTTGIPWVGVKRYTLHLVPGSYAYACSAHFRTMNGTFVVTAN